MNVANTPILNATATPKQHSDDIQTHVKSLEDKLLSNIAALKSHFFNDIFDLGNDITLLKENNEKEKQTDSNNKKDEVISLKQKIKFLESDNSFLKSDINIKLSYHHHLIYSVMKTTFKSEEPKKLIYRDYSNFS